MEVTASAGINNDPFQKTAFQALEGMAFILFIDLPKFYCLYVVLA